MREFDVGMSVRIEKSNFPNTAKLCGTAIYALLNDPFRADCLICPALIREKQLVSSTTSRNYFADTKPDKVHCKLQNCFHLLSSRQCNIQHIGKSITPLNLKMNIHRREK